MKKHLHVIFSPRLPPKSFGVCSKLRGGGQCHLKLMDRSISKASKIRRFGIPEVRRIHGPNRRGGNLHSFKSAMVPRRPASSLSIVGLWKWMSWKNMEKLSNFLEWALANVSDKKRIFAISINISYPASKILQDFRFFPYLKSKACHLSLNDAKKPMKGPLETWGERHLCPQSSSLTEGFLLLMFAVFPLKKGW